MSARLLLILDLNGVLVDRLSKTGGARDVGKPDAKLSGRHVYRRPFLNEFIDFVFAHFDVAMWSRLVAASHSLAAFAFSRRCRCNVCARVRARSRCGGARARAHCQRDNASRLRQIQIVSRRRSALPATIGDILDFVFGAHVGELAFVMSRDDCVRAPTAGKPYNVMKPLANVFAKHPQRSARHTLVLDDSHAKARQVRARVSPAGVGARALASL